MLHPKLVLSKAVSLCKGRKLRVAGLKELDGMEDTSLLNPSLTHKLT
jgi:hypothetical protein